jgi:hypothetical protein
VTVPAACETGSIVARMVSSSLAFALGNME